MIIRYLVVVVVVVWVTAVILSDYSWLSLQELFLLVLRGHMGYW